ncbi:ABC transporter permease [Companilactobacillus sp.]|jgi:iron(III) transport system permease protein|uniref:ABC transporter permease n=1 Tax=Companilactobacillus sp. TaxID=2767905 RepID=UPI0025BCA1FE|nr:iron ABC transporter permease [Companilactobacillus sp.]MCH4009272.1 iron ABC transporter permease [Companilactobacillus sp.]MCH4050549.1 iron ABC transporter permease [Companilactobacillus sp.]MCH4077214.1 iron ABC transporter permease [Companilactobacillus sp.]MCH4125790.1 iron ABC transporter permease [Companilactobacillus sp.]MCI1311499.1 iron ABC transporter permease [Companilactobacillus sp.]
MKKSHFGSKLTDKLVFVILSLGILVFILYPYLSIFVQALQEPGEKFSSFFMQNLELTQHSLTVAISTMILTLILSIAVTVGFVFVSKKWQKVMRLFLLITMVSPPFVTSLAYITLFGRRGMITHDLLHLMINPYGPQGIILMQTLSFTSLNALVLIGLLKQLEPSVINSARSLGAKTDSLILDIILPMLRPGLIVVALISFIRSLADFQTPTIIGGNYNMLASEGYFAVISMGDIHKAALINLTLAIPALIGFFLYIKYDRAMTTQHHGMSSDSSPFPLPKKGVIYVISLILSIIFYLALLLQYGSILLNALTIKVLGNYQFSLQPLLASQVYLNDTITRTIVYSLIAGLLGSLISFLIIYYSQVRNNKWMKFMEMVGTFPYILPGTFFGLGYLYAFSKPPLQITGTAAIVVINVIFKQVAFATKAAKAAVNQVEPTYFKTVHDLGGTTVNEWHDVFFPMTKEGFAITFLNGFISTMTTIGSIIFLVHPGENMMTLVMFDVVQRGEYQVAAVIACLIILICIIMSIIVFGIINLTRRDWHHVFRSRKLNQEVL